MEAEDPLANLADIHLPGSVSFWPPAPGWWVLAFILFVALVFAGIRYAKHWQRQRRLQVALRELEQVYNRYNQQSDPQADHNEAGLQFLYGCNEILKRVALRHFPQEEVAKLNGSQWLRFLDQTGAGLDFSKGEARVLGDGSYRRQFSGNAEQIHKAAAGWIKLRYRKNRATAPGPSPEQVA